MKKQTQELVSVVIPCYNHGHFVNEAVDSVLAQTYENIEIIVVNDGSTDTFTNAYLKDFSKPKTRVLTTKNQGLPSARNNGIKEAKGKYILPLDADDKIAVNYIEKAVNFFEEDENVGIVYGKTELFGDQQGVWNLPKYSLEEMLIRNLIVPASMFKKADWEEIGGYNKNMIYGFEDHDFWLSIIEKGKEVRFIEEVMFYYRKVDAEKDRPYSIAQVTRSVERTLHSFKTLAENHKKLYQEHIVFIVESLKSIEIEKDTLALNLLHRENAIKSLHDINYNLKQEVENQKFINLVKKVRKYLNLSK